LEKIERLTPRYFCTSGAESELKILLTDDEFKFAQETWDLTKTELENTALSHMPRNLADIKPEELPRSNLDRFVFFRVVKDCPNVVLNEGSADEDVAEADLRADTLHLTQYRPINHLVKNGSIQLI
jgi:hypothetical protein